MNYIKYTLILMVLLTYSVAANVDTKYNLTSEIATCIASAAHQHSLDPLLLLAVKYVETANRTDTPIRHNKNGTRDIGLMQINTVWEATLHHFGIDYSDLETPCTNIAVGAWILANRIKRKGLWEGIGAYHSNTPHLSQRYQAKVKAVWEELKQLDWTLNSGD